ncbi:MAG: hypothetical protein VXV96_16765 [Bdellovibrionota bacterium]|nr:hypothetical protein [Bdellovibrionota bacterium]
MSIPKGKKSYSIQGSSASSVVEGTAFEYNEDALRDSIEKKVKDIVFDTEGKKSLSDLLITGDKTDFEMKRIGEVLENSVEGVEPWRIGEALAEAYLSSHNYCFFPWPDGRDERKRGSSLPGADLVGFVGNKDSFKFAFGEIKTTGEQKYPPGPMYGKKGLKKQIEDLKDSESIRNDLFKYLGFRAENSSWENKFKIAAVKYLNDSRAISLYGVLIRDVSPHHDDLRVRIEKLDQTTSSPMSINLLAIYLPKGSIESLPALLEKSSKEEDE